VVSSANRTDRADITEILVKVVLNTINQTSSPFRQRLIKTGRKVEKLRMPSDGKS